MRKLDDFLPRLLVWTPAVPDPLAFQAILDSAIAFCEDTHVVRYITDPIPLMAGMGDYDIDLPANADIARLQRCWFGSLQWANSIPTKYGMSDATTLSIWPVPTGGALYTPTGTNMFLEVATKPKRTATSLADELYTDWIEGVIGGAVARICAMSDQPYSNPANVTVGSAMYAKWVGQAKFEKNKNRLQRDTVVRSRPFA